MADVFDPCACLTDFRFLVSGLAARLPSEYGEWARADLAFPVKLGFSHAHIRIVTEARLAEDGEVSLLPGLFGSAGADPEAAFTGC